VFNLVKNRDRLCIVASVLEAANVGAGKTRIMNLANLSFVLLEKYLDLVIQVGFVQAEGTMYKLTDSGREFLKSYQRFHKRHSQIENDLGDLAREHKDLVRLIEKSPLSDVINPNNFSTVRQGLTKR
jgi:predicted transcriptional regulator